MKQSLDTSTEKKSQREAGLLSSLFLMSWAGLILFGGVAVVIAVVLASAVIIALLGYFLITKIIAILGVTTVCIILGVLLLPGIIIAVIHSLPRKCPVCKEGRLHWRTEKEVEGHPGGAGKLYYGMRSMTEVTTWKHICSCDNCEYEKTRKYTDEKVYI